MTARGVQRFAFVLLLLFPYLIWWRSVRGLDFRGFGEIFLTAFVQASLSTLGSLLLGGLFFLALASLENDFLAELGLLLPNFLPPIFPILAFASWLLPLGAWGIVLAHVFFNSGLVATIALRVARGRLTGMAETAWVLGISRAQFLTRVAWRETRGEIGGIFLFVFALCFTSFSVPLLLSSGRALSPEIAIYDAIRIEGNWSKALALAIAQIVFLILLSSLIPQSDQKRNLRARLPLLGVRKLIPLLLLPPMIVLAAFTHIGWPEWHPDALLLSLALGLISGITVLALLLVAGYLLPHRNLDRFLSGYLAPSPALLGFGLLLLGETDGLWGLLELGLALALLAFPLLYRGMARGEFMGLKGQIETANLLGAGHFKIASEIIWPQTLATLLSAAGLGAVWASGDFALSGILLPHDLQTVPLLLTERMSQYQFASAQAQLLPLLLIGVLLYGFFRGAASYVSS